MRIKDKKFNRACVFMCKVNNSPARPTIAIATDPRALKDQFDTDLWVSEAEALKIYHSLEKALAYIADVREGRAAHYD